MSIRVHPRSFVVFTELSDHQSDGRPAQKSQSVTVKTFSVLCKPTASIEPRYGPLDDPAFGQYDELAGVAALDDLHVDLVADALDAVAEVRPLIAAVGVQLEQEREQTEHQAHQQDAAVAVLHVGAMHDREQQQALGIDGDLPLLSLDLLARVIPADSDEGPLFPRFSRSDCR